MAEGVRIHRVRVTEGLVRGGSLSPRELAEAARFRFQADRDRFVAGRGATRWLLGQALGVAPGELAFGEGAYGKPFVRGSERAIRFNRSHSGDWVLIAISEGCEVGIDVEFARRDIDVLDLGHTVLTASELEALRALQGEARRAAFFRVWTRKEAALKAWGVGLHLEPRELEVGVGEEGRRVVQWPGAGDAGGALKPALTELTIEDVEVDAAHAGAVAWG